MRRATRFPRVTTLRARFANGAKRNARDACATAQRATRAPTQRAYSEEQRRNVVERSYEIVPVSRRWRPFCHLRDVTVWPTSEQLHVRRSSTWLLSSSPFCLALSPHQTFERMVRAFKRSPMYEETRYRAYCAALYNFLYFLSRIVIFCNLKKTEREKERRVNHNR